MFFICGAIYYAVLGDLNFKKQKKKTYSVTTLYCIQWNPDFLNFLGKRKLVRKIRISKNRRWHEIMLDLRGIVF